MRADPIRIAVVGMGKIARDQHLPAIAENSDLVLAATVSPNGAGVGGIPHFRCLETLLADGPAIDAVALCTTPQVRYALATLALARGLHVFLEKPPGATVAEVAALELEARRTGATLLASWHSRFAAGVAPARAWLAQRQITRVEIVWREDVRVWHPGQAWIWQAGGLGVFDPGINALSIATAILPNPIYLRSAQLFFPSNRQAPIAASLDLIDTAGAPVSMDLDWRQTGPQSWDIRIETDRGACALTHGGAVLDLLREPRENEDREYPGLYAHFVSLIDGGASDVDVRPLQLVADAFLRGERIPVAEFMD